MGKFDFDSDNDLKVIDFFCEWSQENNDHVMIEFVLENYEKDSQFDCSKLILHMKRASKIIHQQSFKLPILLSSLKNTIEEKFPNGIQKALEEHFTEDFYDIDNPCTLRYFTFYAICIRKNLLPPQSFFDITSKFFEKQPSFDALQQYGYVQQILIFAGDVINACNPEKLSEYFTILKHRGYHMDTISENDFEVTKTLMSSSPKTFNDYTCLINDDVDYLQEQAAQPNFNPNRGYNVPVWELDPMIRSGTSLACAAAFYGAEKCFRFLMFKDATLHANAGRANFSRFGGSAFIPPPTTLQQNQSQQQPNQTLLTGFLKAAVNQQSQYNSKWGRPFSSSSSRLGMPNPYGLTQLKSSQTSTTTTSSNSTQTSTTDSKQTSEDKNKENKKEKDDETKDSNKDQNKDEKQTNSTNDKGEETSSSQPEKEEMILDQDSVNELKSLFASPWKNKSSYMSYDFMKGPKKMSKEALIKDKAWCNVPNNFIQYSSVNSKVPPYTPIDYAIAGGNWGIIRFLEDSTDSFGTAFAAALQFNRPKIVNWIIQEKVKSPHKLLSLLQYPILVSDNVSALRFLINKYNMKKYIQGLESFIQYDAFYCMIEATKVVELRDNGKIYEKSYYNPFSRCAMLCYSSQQIFYEAMQASRPDIIKKYMPTQIINEDPEFNDSPIPKSLKNLTTEALEAFIEAGGLKLFPQYMHLVVSKNLYEMLDQMLQDESIRSKYSRNELLPFCSSLECRRVLNKYYPAPSSPTEYYGPVKSLKPSRRVCDLLSMEINDNMHLFSPKTCLFLQNVLDNYEMRCCENDYEEDFSQLEF